MSDPWFADPNQFGAWFGSIVGGVGGSLCGGLGAMLGTLGPKGKARGLVLGGIGFFLVLGVLSLGVGVVALAVGQPYAIWYPFLLTGVIFSIVCGSMLPMATRVYRMAEERRLEAESIRSG